MHSEPCRLRINREPVAPDGAEHLDKVRPEIHAHGVALQFKTRAWPSRRGRQIQPGSEASFVRSDITDALSSSGAAMRQVADGFLHARTRNLNVSGGPGRGWGPSGVLQGQLRVFIRRRHRGKLAQGKLTILIGSRRA